MIVPWVGEIGFLIFGGFIFVHSRSSSGILQLLQLIAFAIYFWWLYVIQQWLCLQLTDFNISYEYQISTMLSSQKSFETDCNDLNDIICYFSHCGIYTPD